METWKQDFHLGGEGRRAKGWRKGKDEIKNGDSKGCCVTDSEESECQLLPRVWVERGSQRAT